MKKAIFVCALAVITTATACDGKQHTHTFDKRNVGDENLCAAANCDSAATYYYTCACGEKSDDTFLYGEALGHDYGGWVSDGVGGHERVCAVDPTHQEREQCALEAGVISDDHTLKHSCKKCDYYAVEETLISLKYRYADVMIDNAKALNEGNTLFLSYTCVILEKQETLACLEPYYISPTLDVDSLQEGLFVKCEARLSEEAEIAYTVYYNYALAFSVAQTSNYSFTSNYNDDVWSLEKIDKYGKVLFEKEICS